jgi:hypothetical protein
MVQADLHCIIISKIIVTVIVAAPCNARIAKNGVAVKGRFLFSCGWELNLSLKSTGGLFFRQK